MAQKIKARDTLALKPSTLSMFFAQVMDYQASIPKPNAKMFNLSAIKGIFNKIPKGNIKGKPESLLNVLKRHPKTLAVLVFVVLAAIFIPKITGTNPANLTDIAGSKTDFSPQTQSTLQRRLELPIYDAKGKATNDKLIVVATTLDKTNRILIQGKPATARDTKSFIIINMEIENATTNQLTVRPVDFIRLQDQEGRNFAPDVHNNDVVVEPVSIKKTRVGFVVDENLNTFKFLFGTLNGTKEVVEVNIS